VDSRGNHPDFFCSKSRRTSGASPCNMRTIRTGERLLLALPSSEKNNLIHFYLLFIYFSKILGNNLFSNYAYKITLSVSY
jgi:hypothetical protein